MSFDVQFPGLGLEFTINRVALSIGGFNIYWYGVIIAAGMVLAMLFAFRNADDFGINSDRLIDVILVGAVMAIVCARIYYIVFAPFKYESIWQMIDIRQGGIAIYGAVIGAFVFGGLMAKIRRIPILPLFDLVGICWCLVGVVLLASHIKKRRFNGELFLLYIIWYGLGRYWIEGLRTDALMVTSTLRTSQLVALVSVATAVVLLVAGLQRFKGAQLMVPLQVSNLKKLDAAGTYFVVDELPASASHREFVQATAAMNRRLEEFDLDEAEKVEDNGDNGEAIEEGNVVAEPQQPAEAPETPAPEDEAGE